MGKVQTLDTQKVDPYVPEEFGGAVAIRQLLDRSNGSNQIQFWHSVVDQGFEAVAPVREDQDEVAYVMTGEAEVESQGDVHRLGPGSVLFIPAGTPYTYKVTKGPHEMIAVISPPDPIE